MQEVKLWHSAFLCLCRLTLAWTSSEISTKLLGMPTHLDQSSLTALDSLFHADWSLLLSGVDWPLASPFANCLLSVPLSNSSCVPLPTSGHVEISSPKPFGFAPKQTKESSAWRTTYVVSQSCPFPTTEIIARLLVHIDIIPHRNYFPRLNFGPLCLLPRT